MDAERVALESRIAFLERNGDELNQAVAEQQQAIRRLEQQLVRLRDELDALRAEAGGGAEDRPPPHY